MLALFAWMVWLCHSGVLVAVHENVVGFETRGVLFWLDVASFVCQGGPKVFLDVLTLGVPPPGFLAGCTNQGPASLITLCPHTIGSTTYRFLPVRWDSL